jgi:uncharacterized protein YdiU (UPF0061 family)
MSVVDLAPEAPAQAPVAFLNRFHKLGDAFFTQLATQPLPDPHWVATSPACARLLGLPADWAERASLNALEVLSGNALWPGMRPLASVYSGHQFGVWAGQLGDGRAHLLGEIATPAGPMELQLKGSGLTPYSRMGDGRAVLRSSIREFLCSEAMAGLGIPTTRALCITGSALPVRRETMETAAIVTRVAPSFIRFGHFEHFAHHGQHDALKRLADFVIDHHVPACREAADPYAALLQAAATSTAEMIAQWQAVGFCHGVMNTDNMSILGLTIDYGPFGFLDGFDPHHICNHSDHQGRYAFDRQPAVAFWNLHALAQAMLPLLGNGNGKDEADAASEAALAAVEPYRTTFERAFRLRLAAKFGLLGEREGDLELIDMLMRLLASERTDFTILFRRLADFDSRADADNAALRDMFRDRPAFDAWAARYRERLAHQGGEDDDAARRVRMRRVNPRVVLRNHLAEGAIRLATAGDFSEVARLLRVLERPFDDPAHPTAQDDADAGFPPDWAQSIEVSCSS